MSKNLALIDTVLFALLVLIVAIEFYWALRDRMAGKTTSTGGLL